MHAVTAFGAPAPKPAPGFAPPTFFASSQKRRSGLGFISWLLVAVVLLGVAVRGSAQAAPVDEAARTRLTGNVHPLARPEFDRGRVDSSMPMRVTMTFRMTAAQQADLDGLLAAQQERGSPDYQRWLTPEQFGSRFGLSQTDLNKVTGWLESQEFHVEGAPASRNMITFSGTAQQVESALHTEMHRYVFNGKAHYANASDPSLPAALAEVVLGFRALNNFQLKPRVLRKMSPKFTSGQTANHFIAPGDLATIYDANRLYQQDIDGTGRKSLSWGRAISG